MNKQKTLSILGLMLALIPFMGIPYEWKQIIIFLVGLYVLSITWTVWKRPIIRNDINHE